jgi:hypothetical protein
MNLNQIIFANITALILIFTVYKHTGLNNIKKCYSMFFKKSIGQIIILLSF